jgi:hypothetical protein
VHARVADGRASALASDRFGHAGQYNIPLNPSE